MTFNIWAWAVGTGLSWPVVLLSSGHNLVATKKKKKKWGDDLMAIKCQHPTLHLLWRPCKFLFTWFKYSLTVNLTPITEHMIRKIQIIKGYCVPNKTAERTVRILNDPSHRPRMTRWWWNSTHPLSTLSPEHWWNLTHTLSTFSPKHPAHLHWKSTKLGITGFILPYSHHVLYKLGLSIRNL